MSAQVTEAHRILLTCDGVGAQKKRETLDKLIADSEARATEPMRTLADKLSEQCEFLAKSNRDLIADRDMWKANHDNQVELKGIIASRPDLKDRAPRVEALIAERDQLRAEIKEARRAWLGDDHGHLSLIEAMAKCREDIGMEAEQLRDEVERLKNLLLQADELNEGALFKISETMKRAEKAESELNEMTLTKRRWEILAGERGDALVRAEAKLANAKASALEWARIVDDRNAQLTKERARLDWLERDAMAGDVSLGHYPFSAPNQNKRWALVRNYIEHYADTARAAIDAAMKEGA